MLVLALKEQGTAWKKPINSNVPTAQLTSGGTNIKTENISNFHSGKDVVVYKPPKQLLRAPPAQSAICCCSVGLCSKTLKCPLKRHRANGSQRVSAQEQPDSRTALILQLQFLTTSQAPAASEFGKPGSSVITRVCSSTDFKRQL